MKRLLLLGFSAPPPTAFQRYRLFPSFPNSYSSAWFVFFFFGAKGFPIFRKATTKQSQRPATPEDLDGFQCAESLPLRFRRVPLTRSRTWLYPVTWSSAFRTVEWSSPLPITSGNAPVNPLGVLKLDETLTDEASELSRCWMKPN
jgi:hypothetical protein